MNRSWRKYSRTVAALAVTGMICVTCLAADGPVPADADGNIVITLGAGIRMLLEDSRLVKIEQDNADMSFEDTIRALSPLLPHISANASKTYYKDQVAIVIAGGSVPTGEREPMAWGADIYQTLFDFGKSVSNYKASTEAFGAGKAKVDSVRRTVVLEFIIAYFDVLESEKMISVAQTETETLESYLGDMEQMFRHGLIVRNDLLSAKVKLADARRRLISARNRRAIMAARVNTMLTLPLTREISVTDISMETPCPPDIKQAWAQAEAKRPEMVFYDGMIKSSAMREDAIAVRNLPTVYAGAGYAYTENRYMLHEGNAYIQIGAKMDLYDGGAQGADLEKERARQDQLKEQKYKFIDDIRFEVKNGFVGLSDALEKREVAQEALAQAEENVRYYRAKYNNGAAISTEVLEAISMETGAATNFHVADYDVKRSYARLMYSSGEDIASIYTDRTER